jgi:hypothetical protein
MFYYDVGNDASGEPFVLTPSIGTKTHLSHQLYWGRKAGEKETMSQLIKLRTDPFTTPLQTNRFFRVLPGN